MPGETTGSIRLTRQLHRSGGSTVLAFPPEVLEAVGWERDDDVSFTVTDGKIVLRREDADA